MSRMSFGESADYDPAALLKCGISRLAFTSLVAGRCISNQIIFIGLRSSKDYYIRPGGGVGIWEGSLGCEFLRGSMCAKVELECVAA